MSGSPTPIIVTDGSGHAYVISGASSGAQVAAPTPVVLCDSNGNALVLGAGSLPSGTTGVTQAAGDNSTLLATDQFVTTAVANAIAGVNPAVAVLAASTANVVGTYAQVGGGVGDTFTVTATGAFSLDGVAINTLGQRVLLKNQNTGSQNGIYTCTTVGTTGVSAVFTRAADYNTVASINNTGAIPVQSGTGNTTTSWLLTSQVTSVGSSGSSLVFAQFSYAPAGIALLASPALTGTPTAPTASVLDNSTKIATTAYAYAAVAVEVSRAETAEGLLAPKASPALTGVPTAPTATALTSNTQVATTAYADSAVGVETTRATTAEALKAPLASPALTGSPTAPTQAAFDNSTKIATDAYADNLLKGVSITGFRDDFIGVISNAAVNGAALQTSDTPWIGTKIGTDNGALDAFTGTFTNPGQLEFITGASTIGDGVALNKASSSIGPLGALGSNAGWEINIVAKLLQTTLCAIRLGVCLAGQQVADAPTDGIYVEYDTANTGNTNTDYTWVTRAASTPTYSTTNAIAADATTFHHFRIRSTVAGTILFSVDNGTETSINTNVPSGNMMPFVQVISRTTAAKSAALDFYSYIAATGRS